MISQDVLIAGAVAGVLSGLPSTAYALVTGRSPLEATYAAGRMVLPREARPAVLVAAAVPVHGALSLGWAAVLAGALPRRSYPAAAVAGLAIAALDLGVVGRRIPAIRALPQLPQVADHVAFALAVTWTLRMRKTPAIRG